MTYEYYIPSFENASIRVQRRVCYMFEILYQLGAAVGPSCHCHSSCCTKTHSIFAMPGALSLETENLYMPQQDA